ncbi:MAG TPA: hypothetical protein VHQ20_00165 [Patescibacteria group bacterium]|jgi:hypothetical protein|nr:hypothetical protein [Patescibacteria group bacterium]
MKKFNLKKVLAWLGFMLHCPVCNVKYDFSNIKIVDSEHDEQSAEAHLLIHSDCQKCKSSVMFNIDINGPDIFTVIAKTDLTSKDSDKFSKFPSLNIDDVISVHSGLNHFNGDFIKAFKARK